MDPVQEILEYIDKCCLPKLSRNLEECENHSEFNLWEKNLTKHYRKLMKLLNDINLDLDAGLRCTVISSLLILHYELQSEGPWKTEKCHKCLTKINHQFKLLNGITLYSLFKVNKVVNSQIIFDKTIELLHKKLTAEDFKKYPALIEVYFLITKDVKQYDVILKPSSLLPVSLLLIDDYMNVNKIKGLRCCLSILGSMTVDHFHDGNYYEVIYAVLKKTITEKDLTIIELVIECFLHLFRTLPNQAKIYIIDDILLTILEQMNTETNLYKKKTYLIFLNNILNIHGVHSGKRKLFLTVICDYLDICTNGSVADILLADTLECLENWIKYCWCIWRLQQNLKLLSTLIKLLYINCKNEQLCEKIQIILITLIKLGTAEDQKSIYNNLEKFAVEGINECFLKKLEIIKKKLLV